MAKTKTQPPEFTPRELEVAQALSLDGATVASVAREFGVHARTVGRLRRRILAAGLAVASGASQPPPPPDTRHDAAFWRRKAAQAERENEGLHALVRDLGGLEALQIRADDWIARTQGSGRGSATLIVHNSDRHLGEVIAPEEIHGWNGYDVATCQRRVRRFMNAACELGRRWMADTVCDGVLYTMAGDEISGDIHDELIQTNEIGSLESVQVAAELHVSGLRQLAGEYGRVHVTAVPGNHGRTTRKPTAKKYGALSYDVMIARLVARELRDDERFSFQIAAGPDVITPIYNRPVVTTHGDKIGTGGGKGFAGPVLPIIRGATQVRLQYASMAGAMPELILMGHYHTSAAPPGILANGSVPGLSEFGFGLRGKVDVPRQWLAVMRSRWGLTERCDVQLEEPPQPPKMRVRARVEPASAV